MSGSSSVSEDSDSSREDISEEFSDFDEEFGVQPYQFEPELDISEDGSTEGSESEENGLEDEEQDETRLTNSDW
jgi:hypothetical protein